MDLREVMLGGFDYNFDFSRSCVTKPFSTTFPVILFQQMTNHSTGKKFRPTLKPLHNKPLI